MSEVASLQQRLNDHLVRWDKTIRDFDKVVHEYGERKADLEYRRAVVQETAKAEDPKVAVSALDRMADADEQAYRLHRQYRESEASISAIKARLAWCGAVADALRTEISSERSNAALYNSPRAE